MSAIPALTEADIKRLSKRDLARVVDLLSAIERDEVRRRFEHYFPAETHDWRGQTFHAREMYPRHMECFEAGAAHLERCFMAANRVGKTTVGAYEATLHLTGLYPEWWPGIRFQRATKCWVAGKTNETTRDIIQAELLGPVEWKDGRRRVSGTGMIPGDLLGSVSWRQGVTDLVDTVHVRHVTGEWSTLGVKSYQQGRGSFEGTAKHFVWLDEEPPLDVYSECVTRTMTTGGRVLLTFTPLEGMTSTVEAFQEPTEAD